MIDIRLSRARSAARDVKTQRPLTLSACDIRARAHTRHLYIFMRLPTQHGVFGYTPGIPIEIPRRPVKLFTLRKTPRINAHPADPPKLPILPPRIRSLSLFLSLFGRCLPLAASPVTFNSEPRGSSPRPVARGSELTCRNYRCIHVSG